jgi:hypothetical protein
VPHGKSTGGKALLPGTERRPGVFTQTIPRFFATGLDPARRLRLVLVHALPPDSAAVHTILTALSQAWQGPVVPLSFV